MENIVKFLIVSVLLYASHSQAKEYIKIATFNLRLAPPEVAGTLDGENCWNNRKKIAADLVKFYEFDVFGTQEGWKHQLDYLAQNAGGYKWIGVAREDGKENGEHAAILYNPKRVELLDSGTFWFSETPDVPSKGWDAACRRVCTWGKFKTLSDGKVFFVINSHFDHKGKVARMKESEMLVDAVEKIAKGAPVFVTGDLNAFPSDEPIKNLTKSKKLFDSLDKVESTPYGPVSTFHGFSGKSAKSEFASKASDVGKLRIDYIFVSDGISVKKYGILTNSENLKFPSDHFPVMIEAKLSD